MADTAIPSTMCICNASGIAGCLDCEGVGIASPCLGCSGRCFGYEDGDMAGAAITSAGSISHSAGID